MLSRWGIEFEGVDVQRQPGALVELERLGVSLVPVTVVGKRFVHGWNPEALADLVGVPFHMEDMLPPQVLAARLDGILVSAAQTLDGLDARQLALSHSERPRSLRDLAYHLCRLSAAFVDAMELGGLERDWLQETAPDALSGGAELARYARQVADRLRGWFADAPPERFFGEISTFYGAQPVHGLLERTAWHAGQHLRQVMHLLEQDQAGSLPALNSALFAGLPMPQALW